jgi:pyruvate dehydrogenase E2 component (dihydrolipoyllysine-residue acetyltransferase)
MTMPEVIMPKMGDAMEAGTLSSWLKHEGDQVEVGDVLAEIETDKATMELEAEDAGVLTRLIAGEGDEVEVGKPIAVISADGEATDAAPDEARQGAEETADSADGRETAETKDAETEDAETEDAETKDAETKDAETKDAETKDAGSGEQGARAREAEEQQAATSGPEPSADGRVRASPVVRRLAREHGIELAGISGSGPDGRIVERDVRAALERTEKGAPDQRAQASADAGPAGDGSTSARVTAPAPSGAAGTELSPLSRTQRVVGERMQQAWQAPHHYATMEVHVDELLALRGRLNEALVDGAADGSGDGSGENGPAGGPVRLSINDFVMKACALALRTFPKLNSWWTADGIELHQQVDLAMAVALEDGLITPVIRNAAERTLSAISAEARELAARARSGKLRPDEYQGGTFTVSNMGMYGVESFTAIINPPSVSIVAVSAVARRPDFDAAGDLVPRSVLKLTVGSDHRVVNGAENARYLAEVKRLLEHPLLLTV